MFASNGVNCSGLSIYKCASAQCSAYRPTADQPQDLLYFIRYTTRRKCVGLNQRVVKVNIVHPASKHQSKQDGNSSSEVEPTSRFERSVRNPECVIRRGRLTISRCCLAQDDMSAVETYISRYEICARAWFWSPT